MFQAWQLLWKISTLKYQERGGYYSSGVGWFLIYFEGQLLFKEIWQIYNVVMKNKSSSHRLYSLHLLYYGTFPRFTSTWDKKNQTSQSQNYNKQQVKRRYKCRRALQMPRKSIQVASQSGKTKPKLLGPITTDAMKQSELNTKTWNHCQARKNVCKGAIIGFR